MKKSNGTIFLASAAVFLVLAVALLVAGNGRSKKLSTPEGLMYALEDALNERDTDELRDCLSSSSQKNWEYVSSDLIMSLIWDNYSPDQEIRIMVSSVDYAEEDKDRADVYVIEETTNKKSKEKQTTYEALRAVHESDGWKLNY
jgi:hypothetical protein